jgi:hypothetical protein
MRLRKFIAEARVTADDKGNLIGNLDDDYPIENMDDDDIEKAREVAKLIKSDCQKYIKESEGHVMYRGVGAASRNDWSVRKVHADRYPKDTPQEIHEELNELFDNAFGWGCRNGIFCTGSMSYAASYGNVVTIYPKDGYKYCWSDMYRDLYADANLGEGSYDSEYWEEQWEEEYGEPYDDDIEGNGTWLYNGDDTGEASKMNAIDEAFWDAWEEWKNENSDRIEKAKEWSDAIDTESDEEVERIRTEFDEDFPYDDIEDFNLEDEETEMNRQDEVRDDIYGGDWEWSPAVSLDDYMYEMESESGYYGDLSSIVDEYQDNELTDAIISEDEIMVGPEKHEYYSVGAALSSLVWEIVYGIQDAGDTKQLKLPFNWHPNKSIDKGIWDGNRFFAGVFNVKTKTMEYIITYRDLKKLVPKLQKTWAHGWGHPNVPNPDKWLPREVARRFHQGQSCIFFIPSDAGGKWNALYYQKSAFLDMADEKIARLLSLHVKLAT